MMTKELQVTVENRTYSVVVSDQVETLLAAKAAGRGVLGLWDSFHPERAPFGVPYLIDCQEEITEEYLERIVRRQMGLPWRITETKRLILREFAPEDWDDLQEMAEESQPEVFSDHLSFLAYLEHQYPFYEYGIWAIIQQDSGRLIGAAGIWDMEIPAAAEIGYWIHPSFRRRGYGQEAVQAILQYVEETLADSIHSIYAKIRKGNLPSRKLVQRLGFRQLTEEKDGSCGVTDCSEGTGSTLLQYRFDWSSLPHPDSRE
ncbi:MAG: GNAT family N-acetyltransferase [Lachnospiraceae bacterium]|nr:GNAT family N-acetyltransferase [Lachnospiraceae bacterium]